MRLSCLPVSLYQDLSAGQRTLDDWFGLASELGLDGADLSVVHLDSFDPSYLRRLRTQAYEHGIEIAMMVTYADFTHPDVAIRRQQVDALRQHIQVAHELGASFVRVTAGQAHPGVQKEQGVAWAVHGLTACLSDAFDAGLQLVYENHTKGYAWTYNDFSQPATIFLEIVRQTEGTQLGILYDTANTLATGDDPIAVLEQVKHRVAVLHVNDIRRAGHFEPVVLGTGVAPIVEIFKVLRQEGFDGWISVEEASQQGDDGFHQAVPYADAAWQAAGGAARQVPS